MNFLFHVLLIRLVTKNYDDIDPFHSNKPRNITPFIIWHGVNIFQSVEYFGRLLKHLAGIRRVLG